MNILITGSGGREHALAWRIAKSPLVDTVFVAPGNAGTSLEPGVKNVAIDPLDFKAQIDFATANNVGLTVIGSEDPLVAGVVDAFNLAGLRCFGPTRLAAQLEGSKSFSKAFLEKYEIPTATYRVFDDAEEAVIYVNSLTPPIVIKADGLAAGKGVVIAADCVEAEKTVIDMLSGNMLGGAGSKIVVEEFLEGEEASFIVIADGQRALPFASSQDHKAALDGDRGPNTGGMGAYSPAPVVTRAVHERIMREVIEPTIAGMRSEGYPYVGFLYAGLMINQSGEPKVIEFNCRFGDPETQPIMSRLLTDLVPLMEAAIDGALESTEIEFDTRSALTVVMASGGYPGHYETGKPLSGLDAAAAAAKVFHAGTKILDEAVITSGGRVLGVTALGDSVAAAQTKAYDAVGKISFEGASFRRDIGYRAVNRELADNGSK